MALLQVCPRERTVTHAEQYQAGESLQKGQEIIKQSLKDLEELKRNLHEKLSALDKELLGIHSELDKSGQETGRLKRSINCEFKIIENIISPDWRMRFKQLHSPVLQRRNLEYLGKLDKKNFEEQGMTSHDALNILKESIDELHVISNEGFVSAFKRFTEIKEDSKQHTQDLNEMRSGLESKFLKLKELIQSNLK